MKSAYHKTVILLAVLILSTGLSIAFEGGDGSSDSPYQIATCQQLQPELNDDSAVMRISDPVINQ